MRQMMQLRADMDALQRDNLSSQRQAIFTEMVVAKVADCVNALFDPAVLALKNYVFVEGETAASLKTNVVEMMTTVGLGEEAANIATVKRCKQDAAQCCLICV